MPEDGQDAGEPSSGAERERQVREALGNIDGAFLFSDAPTSGWDKYRKAAARVGALDGAVIEAAPKAGRMTFAVQAKRKARTRTSLRS